MDSAKSQAGGSHPGTHTHAHTHTHWKRQHHSTLLHRHSRCTCVRACVRACVQLPDDLVPCLAAVRDAAKRVTKVAAECKMPDMVGHARQQGLHWHRGKAGRVAHRGMVAAECRGCHTRWAEHMLARQELVREQGKNWYESKAGIVTRKARIGTRARQELVQEQGKNRFESKAAKVARHTMVATGCKRCLM